MNTAKDIEEFLIDTEILSIQQIEKIQDESFINNGDKTFLEIALNLNFISPKIAQEILSMFFSIPQIDLSKKIIDLETFSVLPEPLCREKKIIIFNKNNQDISIAISNFEILDEIKTILSPKYNVNYFFSDEQNINKKIILYQNLLRENWDTALFSVLSFIPKLENFNFKKYDEIPEEYYDEISNSYHSEKFLESLFEYALNSQADFIYLDGEKNNYGIYFRIFSEKYKIMEISKETAVSLIIKLKKLADINIHNKSTIKETNFKAELFKNIHDVYISFIQTNIGTSVAIQIDKKIIFPFSFSEIISTQQEIYFKNYEKSSGLILISGKEKNNYNLSKLLSFASLAELESKKNKTIYSVTTDPIEYKIPEINHISLKKGEKLPLLIAKILKNRPDIIFLNAITKSLIPVLMNFITTGKKVYLSLDQDFDNFIEQLITLNLEKHKIIKNISYIIEHQEFEKLSKNNQKKYTLTSNEQQQIFSFIPEKELLDKLQTADIISKKINKLSKITFYTKKEKKKFLEKKSTEKIFIRGFFEISEILDRELTTKKNTHNIKSKLIKASKKAILENALMSSLRGELDIKDILKYLTR